MHRSPSVIIQPALLLLGGALLLLPARGLSTDTPAWIARSNENAQVLVNDLAKASPEFASRMGVPGYDDKIADLTTGAEDRTRLALTASRDELAKRLMVETDPLVRQDLEILVESANNQLTTNALTQRLMLPYADVAQLIFFGEFSLLDDQIDAARRPAALARLQLYTGLAPGAKPVTELAQERYLAKQAAGSLLPPYKGEVEKHLSAMPRYAAGIRQLYVKYGIDKLAGAPAALDALDTQFKAYADWIRTVILPTARSDYRLPAELYADNLKNIGLDIPPQELMQQAQLAFTEIRNEMRAIAPLVAKQYGFADTDYRAVIRALKKEQITKAEVEPYYRTVIAAIEDIIRREKILTLPDRPMLMRIASEAENAAQPAPHYQPPPLIGSKGEQGVFVLTTGNTDATGKQAGFDDFTYKAGAWAAHRP